MKKLSKLFYCLLMALLVLSLSGCGSDDDDNNNGNQTTTKTAQSRLMVLSSPAFQQNENYKIFRGNYVGVSGTSAKYYVAPIEGDENVVMNLEFTDEVSNDVPFVVTTSDDINSVVFAYNPQGTSYDITTPYGYVLRRGRGEETQQQKYTSLKLETETDSSVQTSEIGIEDTSIITITLDSSDNSATLSGAVTANVPEYYFTWAVSPDHANEYWVDDGEIVEDEDDLGIDATASNGIYIARDVRYVPDYLPFSESQTAPKAKDDTESMYVAYYSTKADGVTAENTYILAALPTSMGMGQPGGGEGPGGGQGGDFPGEPPSGEGPGGGNPPAIPNNAGFRTSDAETGFSAIVSAMTHSEEEAYNNPVLHITKPGTYKLKGTWDGQIWIDIPDKSVTSGVKTKKDPEAHVELILDGVNVNCTVAPALVFKKVYECDQEENYASFDVGSVLFNDTEGAMAGAVVIIGKGSTNTFKGTNVARLNNVEVNDDDDYNSTSLIGQYVKAQDKMYKLDAAFHSRMSMLIGLEDGATSGTLNVTSDYEGLDAEMHMLIDSGTINVTADDDGINVNEDDISVFTMDGGTLTINSSGGDGIDSNGWVVINGGKLNITAGNQAVNSAGEAGIDAEKGYYLYDEDAYTWTAAGNSGGQGDNPGGGDEPGDEPGGEADDDTINPITVIIPDGRGVVNYQSKAVPLASGDLTDAEREEAGIPTEGDVLPLINKVNNFSGMTTK